VSNDGGQPGVGSFTMRVREVTGQEVKFAQTGEDFEEFYRNQERNPTNSPLSFFLSMHFSDKFLDSPNKYFSLYDLSPWSFPVTIENVRISKTSYWPRLKFTEQELPDFNYYGKFYEYQKS
jgi:hypothetical protein